MNEDNRKKTRGGYNNKLAVKNDLNKLCDILPNVDFDTKNTKFGILKKAPRQFSVDVKLLIKDEMGNICETWLIVTSNSVRSDRIKGNEFDVEHIKRIFNEIDRIKTGSVKAFFVVPNVQSEKDLRNFENYRQRAESKELVSYFDGIFKLSELTNYLKNEAGKYIKQGVRSNLFGDNAEEKIVEAFNNKDNITLWNNPQNSVTKSSTYYIVQKVLNKLSVPRNELLQSMEAYNGNKKGSSYLDELANIKGYGGKPKTDILIKIYYGNKFKKVKISIKNPNKKRGNVTVHEGSVEKLLGDLEMTMPSDSRFNDSEQFQKLKIALLDFQKSGSTKGMDADLSKFLNENLSDLNDWLIDYVIFGINNGVLTNNQKADLLVVVDPDSGDLELMTIAEERKKLLEYCNGRKAGFRTPFSWTYPSKKRGKKIQLKMPII